MNYFSIWCWTGKCKFRHVSLRRIYWNYFQSWSKVCIHILRNCSYWMNKKTVTKYSKLCVTVEPILLAIPSLYLVESGFSHVHYLLSKQKYFGHSIYWSVAQTYKPAASYLWSLQWPIKNNSRIKDAFAFTID